MKTITVTIDTCGRPKVEATGFVGGECKNATKPLLDALGAKEEDMENEDKPEIHMFGGSSTEQHMTQ